MGRDKCVPDLCGNKKRFGEVKDLRLVDSGMVNGLYTLITGS